MSEQGVTLSRETVEALRHFTEAIFAGTDYPSGKHIHARVLLEALQADLCCAEQSTTEEPAGAPNRRRRERLVVTAPRQVKVRLAQAASETAATPDRPVRPPRWQPFDVELGAEGATLTQVATDRRPVLSEAETELCETAETPLPTAPPKVGNGECSLADAMCTRAQRNPDFGVYISAQTLREWSRQVRGLAAARDRLVRRIEKLEQASARRSDQLAAEREALKADLDRWLEQQITRESEAGCDE